MSEIPERIEREMFEIRSRMSSDMTDLRQHVEPQVVAERVKQTASQRLREAWGRIRANFLESVKRQFFLVREAGEKRDPSRLTDAVRRDPRPFVFLAILLVVTLLMARRVAGNRGDRD
ncbi:MAG TPA: DUF3618 domain-containing protein [Rubrobacteraceae bacterium]|nr:DUF3618 domain-containing protein [Rubrobacteraceae bacterium]